MAVSMAAFTFNDACVKYVALSLPLFQTIFLRGCVVIILMMLLAWYIGNTFRPIPRREWGKVALRALAELAAFLPFIIALTLMPFANLVAILQALPLTLTFAGAVFLGERVGWRRWIAITVGFLGVLLIVKPGLAGFNSAALLGVLAVIAVTVRDVITRRLAAGVPSLLVSIITAVAVTLLGLIGSLFEPWQTVHLEQGVGIILAALFIALAYLSSVMVMRVGEIGFVTQFRYTAMIWGLLLGWFVFGEWPDMLTLLGAAIIVVTGLFTLWRNANA